MKMIRSLSVIDEDEPKYDYNDYNHENDENNENDENDENDETNVDFLPPNIMAYVTIILNILNETYTRILDYLKWNNHTETDV